MTYCLSSLGWPAGDHEVYTCRPCYFLANHPSALLLAQNIKWYRDIHISKHLACPYFQIPKWKQVFLVHTPFNMPPDIYIIHINDLHFSSILWASLQGMNKFSYFTGRLYILPHTWQNHNTRMNPLKTGKLVIFIFIIKRRAN